MKKSLFALAVLGAFAGAAQAQSSVTLYGTLDTAVGTETNVSGNASFTGMRSSLVENTAWGMKGTEDLGGGMKSHFNLESQFENNGQINGSTGPLFGRAANVGISGAFGDITAGLQFNPYIGSQFGGQSNGSNSFAVNSVAAGSGAAGGYGAVNFFPSNSIRYDLPKFANISITGFYASGNNSSANSGAGNTTAATAEWSNNGIALGGGYQKITASYPVSATAPDETDYTVFAKYTTGPFSIGGNYINLKTTTAGLDTSVNLTILSAGYQVSPAANIALGYSTAASSSKVNLLGTYALSKRTYLYAMVDTVNNSSSTGSATFTNFFAYGNAAGTLGGANGVSSTGVAAGLVTHF